MSHDDREESLSCQPCNDAGADVDMLRAYFLYADFAVDEILEVVGPKAEETFKLSWGPVRYRTV